MVRIASKDERRESGRTLRGLRSKLVRRSAGLTFFATLASGLACPFASLSADQVGPYTYEVVGDSVTITAFSKEVGGEVEIPAEIVGLPVQTIGPGAFQNCSLLTSVSIPPSLTSIGKRAFQDCAGLLRIRFHHSENLTRIDDWAFEGCSGITTLTLPSSITTIGDYVFEDCKGMTSITLPEDLVSLGSWVFEDCNSLTSITIPPGVTSLGLRLFYRCHALRQVDLPPTVTVIRSGAFEECSALPSIDLPEGLTMIGDSAFWNCSGLSSLSIPESVTAVGRQAFTGCSALRVLRMPAGVTSIGEYAFEQCTALRTVAIPDTVAFIGEHAFDRCTALKEVLFCGDAPTLGRDAFPDVDTNAQFTVYYLEGNSEFTSPTWEGYPANSIDPAAHLVSVWLTKHGYPHDTDLTADPNRDGVNLLTAYALNLHPRLALQGSIPVPVLENGVLSLTFFGATPGVTYSVETSVDLKSWTTAGVNVSDPDPKGIRTATAPSDTPRRYLRLLVTH